MGATSGGGNNGRALGLAASFSDILLMKPVPLGPCSVGQSIRNVFIIFLFLLLPFLFLNTFHTVTLWLPTHTWSCMHAHLHRYIHPEPSSTVCARSLNTYKLHINTLTPRIIMFFSFSPFFFCIFLYFCSVTSFLYYQLSTSPLIFYLSHCNMST